MLEALKALFDTEGFPPRWNCGSWTPLHGWAHVLADLAIFGAYAAIPVTIAYFVIKRRSVLFPGLYALFGAFIFSCGLGHLIDASLFWHPWYRFYAVVKVITAIASWATVVALFRLVPRALELPQIAKLNEQLRIEVSERARAESEVRRLNHDLELRITELETLLEVLPVGIGIAVDRECKTIRTNPAFARLLRVDKTPDELFATIESFPARVKAYHADVEIPMDRMPIHLAAREGVSIRDFEADLVFPDGSQVSVLAYASPLLDREHRVIGAVGAFADITARKEADARRSEVERQLLESQKLESLGILAGGVAHDFNNLLVGVLGSASMLRAEVSHDPRLEALVDAIEQSGTRAADLCRQMLAYSGRGRFVLVDADISAVVLELAELMRSSVPRRIEFDLDFEPNLPPVLADVTQLRQVVMNLVLNAAEAIGDQHGRVVFRTRKIVASAERLAAAISSEIAEPGEYVELEVVDDGCGMSAEVRKRMFEPFFSTKFTGRGLGLAATLGIVRGHRGAIEVASQPGSGTRVSVLLPVRRAPAEEPRSATTDSAPVDRVGERETPRSGEILVIDDEQAVRMTLAGMLSRVGFSVVATDDGESAVRWVADRPDRFILAIVDLTMPKMDGDQVSRALRRAAPNLPTLVISGYDEAYSKQQFHGFDRVAFLQKPFTHEALVSTVTRLLAR